MPQITLTLTDTEGATTEQWPDRYAHNIRRAVADPTPEEA